MTGQLSVKTVRSFRMQLENKAFSHTTDGFSIDPNGEKTNINYYNFLNDFGRNMKARLSFKV